MPQAAPRARAGVGEGDQIGRGDLHLEQDPRVGDSHGLGVSTRGLDR